MTMCHPHARYLKQTYHYHHRTHATCVLLYENEPAMHGLGAMSRKNIEKMAMRNDECKTTTKRLTMEQFDH